MRQKSGSVINRQGTMSSLLVKKSSSKYLLTAEQKARRLNHLKHGPLDPDEAAKRMQCTIRCWRARQEMAGMIKRIDTWERMVRKYPHVYHIKIATTIKATVNDLVRSSLSQQERTENLTAQVHRLIVCLGRGPLGSSEDLRLSQQIAEVEEELKRGRA